jgi:hypothetical protein
MIKTLKKQYQNELIRITSEIAVNVANQIVIELGRIPAQPGITGIVTGMGTWDFTGEVVAYSNQSEDIGERITYEIDGLDDLIRNDDCDNEWYTVPCNISMKRIVELVDFLVDGNENEGLNCSSWQEGFSAKGVIFEHSETSDQNNPFSVPNMKYVKSTAYYKALKKAKVPIVFVCRDKVKSSN